MVDKKESQVFDAIRFPLMFVIVASHVIVSTVDEPVSLSLSGDNLYIFLSQLFARSLVRMAVPCFAFISGYYFFFKCKEAFSSALYIDALRKRFWSLLLPFIIWGLIYYIALWAKNTVSEAIGFPLGVSEVEISVLQRYSLIEFIWKPIHATTWYLKSLMFATILSPLVFLSIKYLRVYSLWVVILLYFVFLTPNHFDKVYYFFFFGSYFSIRGIDIISSLNKYYKPAIVLSIFGYPLLVFANMEVWHKYLELALIPIGIVAVIGIYDYLYTYRRDWFNRSLRLAPSTFFIYLIHTILWINLIRDSLYNFTPLGSTGWGRIIIYFATSILVTWICVMLYRLGRRYTPSLLSFALGGRIV